MKRQSDDRYEWFFRTEYATVLRTAFLIVGDDETARDIAQDAFIQLLRKWKTVSRYDCPEAWVRRVAIRMAVRAVKRRRLHERVVGQITPDHKEDRWPDPDLRRAVASLPAAQRAAIVLFYFEDQPASEIAHLMDCSQSTVKVHLHKARKRLEKLLEEGVRVDAP